MAFNKIRVFVLLSIVAGVAVGFGVAAFDPGVHDTVELGIVLVFLAAAGGAGFWYYRTLQETGEFDERSVRIQYRASTASFSALLIALGVLVVTLTITEVDVPVNLALIGLIFGGILADELFIEYYRRQM